MGQGEHEHSAYQIGTTTKGGTGDVDQHAYTTSVYCVYSPCTVAVLCRTVAEMSVYSIGKIGLSCRKIQYRTVPVTVTKKVQYIDNTTTVHPQYTDSTSAKHTHHNSKTRRKHVQRAEHRTSPLSAPAQDERITCAPFCCSAQQLATGLESERSLGEARGHVGRAYLGVLVLDALA
eukprot:scaffold29141_cov144-Isochrysis_galbana.AAC.1